MLKLSLSFFILNFVAMLLSKNILGKYSDNSEKQRRLACFLIWQNSYNISARITSFTIVTHFSFNPQVHLQLQFLILMLLLLVFIHIFHMPKSVCVFCEGSDARVCYTKNSKILFFIFFTNYAFSFCKTMFCNLLIIWNQETIYHPTNHFEKNSLSLIFSFWIIKKCALI